MGVVIVSLAGVMDVQQVLGEGACSHIRPINHADSHTDAYPAACKSLLNT